MALCRGQRLAAIRRAVRQGQLQLPAGMRPQGCANLLNTRGRAQWHGHLRARYPHGVGVLPSLARYRRGGPLANRRLGSWAQGEVTFRYRVHGAAADGPRSGLMPWSVAECIGRYLRHVPAPGTRVVRAYGRYAAPQGEALTGARTQLGQGPVTAPVVLDWQTACRQRGAAHPACCPICGQRLVCRGMSPRPRLAPFAPAPAEGAA
jgi:Putative transposase